MKTGNIDELLAKFGQDTIINHLKELDEDEKSALIAQLEKVDFSLFEKIKTREEAARGKITPLIPTTLKDRKSSAAADRKTGLDAIRAGKAAAVVLAGGMGSRLGYDHAKGMYDIGETKPVYIFECLIKNLMAVTDEAEAFVPLYIMTNKNNVDEIKSFLKEHEYFGYPEDFVTYYVQGEQPSISFEGQLLLAGRGELLTAPDGNGGWFTALAAEGLLDDIAEKGIEWINVFAVDNVLQQIADPEFIGATINSGRVSGAKVVAKADPREKVGAICLEDGRPSIVEYYDLTDEMAEAKEADGTYSYNYGVILNYLFRVKELISSMKNNLPLHVVEKKVPFWTPELGHVTPEKPNAYKFETLVLDQIHMLPDCLAFEVEREKEFAPIKNLHGVDSVDSARELLKAQGREL